MNPYVFIVGGARSGTTLLQRTVDAHPDIAIIHESHRVPRFYEKRNGLTPGGTVTPELVARLPEDRRFVELGTSREELEGLIPPDGPISYAHYVARVFDLYGEARGKRLVGEDPGLGADPPPCTISGLAPGSSTSSATAETCACPS